MGDALEKEKEDTEIIDDETIVDDSEISDEETETEVEEWMKEGDEGTGQGEPETISLASHIRAKRKLKGRISDQNDELERLRAENAELKASKAKPLELPKRPRRADFEDDDKYEDALDEYELKREEYRSKNFQQTQDLRISQETTAKRIEKAINSHYERADKLLESSGITAEAFKASDQAVRDAVESIMPKVGDIVVDQLISKLGEGSEKVFFKLGRSKALLGEFIALLANDPTGIEAAAFLGQQKGRLLNTVRKRSNATPPDTQLSGDETAGQKEKILKRRYDEAHKKGDGQKAWNAKKDAKAAGIDTSKW